MLAEEWSGNTSIDIIVGAILFILIMAEIVYVTRQGNADSGTAAAGGPRPPKPSPPPRDSRGGGGSKVPTKPRPKSPGGGAARS